MSLTASWAGLLFARIGGRISEGRWWPFLSAHLFLKGVALAESDSSGFFIPWSPLCLLLNVLLDFFGHGNERLFNIDGALCGGLKEGDLVMSCEFSALVLSDFAYFLHVTFISNEDLAHPWVSKTVYFYHPLTHVLKRIPICHVIHNNDSVSPPVIAAGKCAEPFLSGCVPYLQFHCLFIQGDCLYFLYTLINFCKLYKVNSYGVEKVLVKGIFLISEKSLVT